MNTTTETVQHTPTPTPWHYNDKKFTVCSTECGNEKPIAVLQGVNNAVARTESMGANAAFIVRACNNHEALVAALKPFAALIDWADVSESDADDEAFLTGARNGLESFCGIKTAVLTVGDLRRAKAAIATVTP